MKHVLQILIMLLFGIVLLVYRKKFSNDMVESHKKNFNIQYPSYAVFWFSLFYFSLGCAFFVGGIKKLFILLNLNHHLANFIGATAVALIAVLLVKNRNRKNDSLLFPKGLIVAFIFLFLAFLMLLILQ